MPLPVANLAWPPAQLAPITAKQAEWDAWYVGDPHKLHGHYSGTRRDPFDRVSQHRGGVVGAFARMWWGRPNRDLTKIDDDRLHVPLPTDLCQASADLLYANPPSLSSTDKTTAKELDKAVEGGVLSSLIEGAEVAAALGDVYYRVTWDTRLTDRSFITPVHADAAWPEFRWGRLVAVTFWWVVDRSDNVVRRHVERHELDPAGNGVILHGLYEGTPDNLGHQVPLAEHTSTAGIPVDADSTVLTNTPGLATVHVPNQRPQRRWRNHPIGASLGRSDFDVLEPHFDKLDMVYSSWMRDIRLAKARLIVPAYMLESGGPGAGMVFDTDQDVFTSLNAPPREDGRAEITPQQFGIRVEQHERTVAGLVGNILRTAGYSAQTFGEAAEGGDMTATEIDSRDRRSNLTRDRKIRAAKPALGALLRKKLLVDAEVFRTGVSDANVKVDFPDVSQASPESLARTNQLLFQAQAASAKVRVQLQHPDWDEKQVETEAEAILSEFGTSVPDPFAFRPGVDEPPTGDGADVGSQGADQP